MKVLIIGSEGFVGRNVLSVVQSDPNLNVVSAGRSKSVDYNINLLERESIHSALTDARPDVIVNCAGIVTNTDDAYKNGVFCRNLLEAVLKLGKPYPKIIVSGSAAEYGVVEDVGNPVSEDVPLYATSKYGKSKVEEEKIALNFAEKYSIDVVVARIFNPIGPDMGEKFLVTSLLKQLMRVRNGEVQTISISRGDSLRDYIDVRDVAGALHRLAIADKKNRRAVYNIGSGRSTSNRELIEVLLNHIELPEKPTIIETQDAQEPTYAARADISRIKLDLGWQPKYSLDVTVEDIINAQSYK
jgi:nucleoside-diphosphate-sugar epimerase